MRKPTILRILPIVLCLPFLPENLNAAGGPKTLPILNGEYDTYVAVRDFADFHGLPWSGSGEADFRLETDEGLIVISRTGRRMTVGGVTVWLHAPPGKIRRRWAVAEADYRTVIEPLLNPSLFLSGRGCKIILLDPGHGGEDSGAQSGGMQEKELVLDVARRLRVELAQDGFQVLMTRDNDRFIPLEERSARAREWNADLMISLHANSAGNPKARGLETYIMTARGYPSTTSGSDGPPDHDAPAYLGNEVAGASALLGYALHRNLIEAGRAPDRGLRHARFMVLRETHCPSALVELGFVTNDEDRQQFRNDEYIEALVRGLAEGVRKYAAWVSRAQPPESETPVPAAAVTIPAP